MKDKIEEPLLKIKKQPVARKFRIVRPAVRIRYRRVEPIEDTIASYPAMPIVQNDQRFYLASLPVEDIFPWCFVTRRVEDPKLGFQRNLNEDRALDIAAYLDNSKGSIPTNIVLSAQPNINFEYEPGVKTIRYTRKKGGFLVIDGQHRLYGYSKTVKKHRVPVAIYEGLNRSQEASLFIDINTNQRGVPASLLLDIKQVAERENEREFQMRKLFDYLNANPKSPLNGLLSPAESARGKISRVTFNRAMSELYSSTAFASLSEEKQHSLVTNYFSAVEKTIRPPKLLFKSIYFEAICGLFPEVIRLSLGKHHNLKEESLLDILAPIHNIDLSAFSTAGSTRLTKAPVSRVLQQAISSHIIASDDMV